MVLACACPGLRRGLRSLINLNRSIVDVERLKGTLLDDANVKWEDE